MNTKTKLVLALVTLMSSNAMAANRLLELSVGGGFFARFAGHTVSVDDDGAVRFMRYSSHGVISRPAYVSVATLSEQRLETLKARLSRLERAELVDYSPEMPECMDAPTTTYTFYPAGAEPFHFAQTINCHTSYLKDQAVNDLMEMLDGLERLAILE